MSDPSCIWCGRPVTSDDSYVRISPAQWLHINNAVVDCYSAHRAMLAAQIDGKAAA